MGRSFKISVCSGVKKSVNINLIARLSVVYITICILIFYKIYTRKLNKCLASNNFFIKMLSAFLVCCIHSHALQKRFFHGDNATGEQSDLGPYCLQYKLQKNINSKLHKNINRLGKQTIGD